MLIVIYILYMCWCCCWVSYCIPQ